MISILERRPSPAMAVALIALFVALGGSGYAAVKINGKNIIKRSIAGSKLKARAVTGTEVKNASLRAADFKPGQLPAGPPGAIGPRGPQGAPGLQGQAGAPGSAVGFAYVEEYTGTITVNPAFAANITAANVTRAGPGIYCFHNLPFTPKSIMVMGEAHGFYDSLAKGSLTSCGFTSRGGTRSKRARARTYLLNPRSCACEFKRSFITRVDSNAGQSSRGPIAV